MKRHCAIYLPNYMVPDTITFCHGLPTTSTDKVDYQRLGALASGGRITLVRRRLRHIWSWKFAFYEVLLPVLRRWGRRVAIGSSASWAGWRWRSSRVDGRGCARPAAPPRRWTPTGRSRRSGRTWRPTRRGSWRATTRWTASPTRRSCPGSTSGATSVSAPRWSGAGARSSWAATWGPTSRGSTGCTVAASPCGCWCNGPATSRAS